MAEERIIKIFIDDGSLDKVLEKDRKLVEKLDRQLANLKEGSSQWNKVTADREKILQRIGQAEGQLAGKLGPTLQMLKNKQRELNRELNQMPIELRNSSKAAKELKKVEAELARVRMESGHVNRSLGGMNKTLSSVGSGVKKYFNLFLAGAAALGGLVFSLGKAKDAFVEFDAAAAQLSSLTGLTGSNLEYLKNEARELSTAVLEGGIRIRSSAKEILEAYTVVGSQRPELLKNKEALAEVTKQALILAEASGGDLKMATSATTTSLNQFNLEADQSSRVINTLAAGSKVGAGNVGYLQAAIEKAGTVAAQKANISFEQTVGLVETLAPRFSEASQAGTTLRGVLLKMETGPEKFKPSVVGLTQALDNLNKAELSTVELKKLFGEENITAASILIKYRGEVDEYTRAVTESSVASEQAAINSDTEAAKLAQKMNVAQNLAITLGEKLAPAAGLVLDGFNALLGVVTDFISAPVSQKLEEERMGLKSVELQLLDTNTTHENRVKLIKDLQSQYPEYLGSLNAETANNQQLRNALQEVNDMLINKIILQKEDEQIQEQNEKIAKQRMEVLNAEDDLREKLAQVAEKNNITLKENMTLEQQAQEIVNAGLAKKRGGPRGRIFNEYAQLGKVLDDYKNKTEFLNGMENTGNAMLEKKNELVKRLGIEVTKTAEIQTKTAVQTVDSPSGSGGEGLSPDALKKIQDKKKRELEKYLEDVKKINEEVAGSNLEGQDKEIFAIKLKYAKLIDEGKRLTQETTHLEELRNQEINGIVSKYDDLRDGEREKRNEQRLKDEQSVEDQLLQMQRKADGNEKNRINAKYDELKIKAHENQELLAQIEKQRIDEVTAYEKQKRQEMGMFLLNQAEVVFGAINTIIANNRKADQDAAIEANRLKNEKENADLNRAMEAELNRKGVSEQKKSQIEASYAQRKEALALSQAQREKQLKLEAWQADKRAQLGQAIIAGALAVIKALPNPLQAIAAGVAAGANIATIAAQKPPKFAKGHKGTIAGVPPGPSHSRGGLNIVDSNSGMKVAEMEGGEPYMILSGNTYKNNRAIVDSLLHSSLNRSGAPIDFPRFGIQPKLNFDRVVSASKPMKEVMFASGGTFNSDKVSQNSGNSDSGQSNEIIQNLEKAIMMMIQTNQALIRRLSVPIESKLVMGNKELQDIDELRDENSYLESGGNF